MYRRMATTVRAVALLLTVLITTGCVIEHAVSPRPITAEVAREMALQQFTSTTPVTQDRAERAGAAPHLTRIQRFARRLSIRR